MAKEEQRQRKKTTELSCPNCHQRKLNSFDSGSPVAMPCDPRVIHKTHTGMASE